MAATFALFIPSAAVAHASDIAATRTTLTSENLGAAGTKLTAQVTAADGAAANGGTVDFVLPSGQSVGSAIVNAEGTATLTVSSLPATSAKTVDGTTAVALSAHYNPTADYEGSVSPNAAVATANANATTTTQAQDFSVTADPTTITVTPGVYGNSSLTLTSLGGFTGPIQLSCSNLPAQVTCVFNPTQATLAADGTYVSTLQLTTQAASGTASSAISRHSAIALAFVLPGSLMLLGLARRRKLRYAQWIAVAMLVTTASLGMSGCAQRYGYTHHPPTVATGTLPGTYSIVVTAQGDLVSSAITHTLTISLVVS